MNSPYHLTYLQVFLPALFVVAGMLVATMFPPTGDPKPLSLVPTLLSQICGGAWSPSTIPYANTARVSGATNFINRFV